MKKAGRRESYGNCPAGIEMKERVLEQICSREWSCRVAYIDVDYDDTQKRGETPAKAVFG